MPVSQIDRIHLEKAATDEGFGIVEADDGEWIVRASLGTDARIRLSVSNQGYLVATDHASVAADLASRWQRHDGPMPTGFQGFVAVGTTALHALVREIWRLARALPTAPLHKFEAETQTLPRTTEAERLVVQRVGQTVFREALLDYWGGACAVTGVADSRLLRASHIKPWAKCDTDAERLNVFNGLLLAAHLDAAFDAGLISFDGQGKIVFSQRLADTDRDMIGFHAGMKLSRVTPAHRDRLGWHRDNILLK